MSNDHFDSHLRAALSRGPDAAWIRADLAILGWGESKRIEPGVGVDRFDRALRDLKACGAPIALASFTFDENFGGSVVLVPEIVLVIDGSGDRFISGSAAELPPTVPSKLIPRGRMVESDRTEWIDSVKAALTAIKRNEVEKVVLSRELVVELEDRIPAHLVLTALAMSERDSHTFLVHDFIGSSPELLISLQEGRARSVSLAGSADMEDRPGSRSFESEKMMREHALAADSVEDSLAPFCLDLSRSPSQVVTYGGIRHLSTLFDGNASIGTRVTDLLSALHPTAAVAGTPTKSALELIRELESHDRGRYAGPVGWLTPSGDGEFAIALRCGLIEGSRATLYTGAGLVEGSDPQLEFEETQIKLRPMLGALGLS